MYNPNRLLVTLFVLAMACTAPVKKQTVFAGKDHIKFNHLYLVLDSITYQLLSDSIPFLKEFSGVRETNTVTKDETWSGKYLYGKGQYLELFGPAGYPGARTGDLGLGFMTNKMGTLDSLYHYWLPGKDSLERKDRTIIDKGVSSPWFTSLAVYDQDSLQLRTFLLENAREELLYVGFTEAQLQQTIGYWEYMRYARAKNRNTSPDSITFTRLFEKVERLYLSVSGKELALLREHLTDFGFTEKDKIFHSNELEIHYELVSHGGQLLRQMDCKLTRPIASQEIRLNRLTIKVSEQKASFLFK